MKKKPVDLQAYNLAVQKLLNIVARENPASSANQKWPCYDPKKDSLDVLQSQIDIIEDIYHSLPGKKDEILLKSYASFQKRQKQHPIFQAHYIHIRQKFIERHHDANKFLKLYHKQYIMMLSAFKHLAPQGGEALMIQENLTHVPLKEAQKSALKISLNPLSAEDTQLLEESYPLPNSTKTASLRKQLTDILKKTLSFLNAGAIFAMRFHYLNNFALLGIGVLRVLLEAQRHLKTSRKKHILINTHTQCLQKTLIEFFEAHLYKKDEKKQWYGQAYSYMVRDLIDTATYLSKRLKQKHLSPLNYHQQGRFQEYGYVGKTCNNSFPVRSFMLIKVIIASRRISKFKRELSKDPDTPSRHLRAWEINTEWGKKFLESFQIKTTCQFHPEFEKTLKLLGADPNGKRTLFLPTHQSILDHPAMYSVFLSETIVKTMGWERPTPCTLVSRQGLSKIGDLTFGPFTYRILGMHSQQYDHIAEEIDKHIIIDSNSNKSIAKSIQNALDKGPVAIYPKGTTATFSTHCFPLQYNLFANIPYDTILIPMAFRGVHSLWPKCPKGNLNICQGKIEIFFGKPLYAENIFFPRQSKLRKQFDIATFFQAIQITDLLNPQPSSAS